MSRALLLTAALAVAPALAFKSVSCPADLPVSCHNTTVQADTCCFDHPGGQLLLTQFWDSSPVVTPSDKFTIHGLWPDNCDGTYEQYCDPSRELSGPEIRALLNATAPCTLAYMDKNWKSNDGDDATFWSHEFNKHGTCMSTLEPRCYPGTYTRGQEMVDYMFRTVALHKTLPSYDWLAEDGILPSSTQTYTLAAFEAALGKHHGHKVIINCNRNNELTELWYHYNIKGSVQNGVWIPADPVGASTCKDGIKYKPKNAAPTSTTSLPTSTTATATSTSTNTPAPGSALSGRGYFYVTTPAAASGGFLISKGTWYRAGGTPATYTATPAGDGSSFTLTTSQGKCAIQADSSLSCGAAVTTGSLFGYDGAHLTYGGSATFYATALPSGTTQGTVYTSVKDVSFVAAWSPL